MFLGINIFTVTESESSGPKSSQGLKLTVNQEAFIHMGEGWRGRPPELRKFMIKQKTDASSPRIRTINKVLCYGKFSKATITTHVVIKQ